ncbi:SpoIIE family protein phosphatase [uncultured Mailhella sp.]|uniref:PP2C family protein-serine/threonine phosphatase n=1 Tax=uncultured Mailhella sp. TaxID=1981031 RepID=UPI0025EC802A|nr:SpoIIE family protein phosphatase [uncultured Mailhella sp.]
MNFSLRSKLFLLVGAAISLAAVPIILFSRASLLESGMEREREAFVNTVMLVEDGLSVRYLNLLTSEVESVLQSKKDLRQYAVMMRDMLLQEHGNGEKISLERWSAALNAEGLSLAFYDMYGRAELGGSLTDLVLADGRQDFKGQSTRSMLAHREAVADGQFAVVRVPGEGGQELPVLVCFMPVRNRGTLVLAAPVADAEKSRKQLESRMALGIQERLDTLELSRGASISVVSSDGRVLAGKGEPMQLSSIPRAVLELAGRGQAQEGDTEGSENPVLYRLAYFKAMDWYVAAAIPLSAINGPAEMLTRHLFAVAAVLLALSLMLMLVLTMRIIAPLRLLTRRAGEIAREDFSSERGVGFSDDIVEGLPVDRKDEVGQLAGAFAHMVKALDENIRRLVDTLAVRQRLQGELNAAHDIQMGILPPPDGAPKSLGYSAAAFLEPAKEVGGDLYDFFTAPDGRQAVVIGDVSDKGVSAALFMSMTVTLVRYALAEGLSCSEAMLRINERLAENNPSCMFVTLFIGLFDPATGRLDYASGAHCPPFVVNPNADVPVRMLTETSGPLVGAMQGLDYEACHAVIAPGEYCLLYTDGVSEAMNEKLELFGEERIAATLEQLRGASPDEVLHGVMTAVKKYRGKAPQSDDITMLCFRRAPE